MKHQFPTELHRASRAKRSIVASKVKMTMIHEAFFTIFALLVACLDIGLMVYAWNNRQLSVGSVVALITLIDNAYTPIAILNVIYIQYKLDKAAWVRFEGLLDLKEDRQLQEGELFDAFSNEIRVENVSFAYCHENIAENNKKILNDVSLTIQKGQKVAFVGESGSGKSTLAKILIGLLKYESGEILIDDKPLKRFSLESLYEKVSYLSQDTPVFDGTIRENLVFEKEVLEDELYTSLEIHNCCNCLQLWTVVLTRESVRRELVCLAVRSSGLHWLDYGLTMQRLSFWMKRHPRSTMSQSTLL